MPKGERYGKPEYSVRYLHVGEGNVKKRGLGGIFYPEQISPSAVQTLYFRGDAARYLVRGGRPRPHRGKHGVRGGHE